MSQQKKREKRAIRAEKETPISANPKKRHVAISRLGDIDRGKGKIKEVLGGKTHAYWETGCPYSSAKRDISAGQKGKPRWGIRKEGNKN